MRKVLYAVGERRAIFSGSLLNLCPGKSELFLLCDVAEQLNGQWKTDLFSSKSTCVLFRWGMTV